MRLLRPKWRPTHPRSPTRILAGLLELGLLDAAPIHGCGHASMQTESAAGTLGTFGSFRAFSGRQQYLFKRSDLSGSSGHSMRIVITQYLKSSRQVVAGSERSQNQSGSWVRASENRTAQAVCSLRGMNSRSGRHKHGPCGSYDENRDRIELLDWSHTSSEPDAHRARLGARGRLEN